MPIQFLYLTIFVVCFHSRFGQTLHFLQVICKANAKGKKKTKQNKVTATITFENTYVFIDTLSSLSLTDHIVHI